MPIYEYACRGCGHHFEQLVRPGDTPACPACAGQALDRLLSQVVVSSAGTRERSVSRQRQVVAGVRDEQDRAHREYVKKHHDDHDHG